MNWFRLLCCILLSISWSGCGSEAPRSRGVILISIDTLRPDHLGAYGYERDTSPFLDSLAERGVLFERVVAHSPNTLTSHMSFFTGLYPAEHAVYPPDSVLSPEIPTLPELFAEAGFRTGGFAEDVYMKGTYGFARGFERWNDQVGPHLPVEIERTVERGLEFLDDVADDQRFFLFLHTYAVHDPYDPPEPYRSLFWDGPRPEGAFDPVAPNLMAFNRRERGLSRAGLEWFKALYDGSIRYTDSILEGFFAELEGRGLLDEVTVVVTSDHGEEFLEHGHLAHTQVYDENLRIPLIVVRPGVAPKRVSTLVEGVDLFPTLLELAGLAVPDHAAGRSRMREILHGGGVEADAEAYGETERGQLRTLYRQEAEGLLQLVQARFQGWFGRQVEFDVGPDPTRFELRSYERPRRVEVRLNGELLRSLELSTDWTPVLVDRGDRATARRLEITSDSCEPVGSETGGSCRGFEVRQPSLQRLELFNLHADPLAATDLSKERGRAVRRLLGRLRAYERQPVAPSEEKELTPELEEHLRALGYL